jgi:hypothetical protein
MKRVNNESRPAAGFVLSLSLVFWMALAVPARAARVIPVKGEIDFDRAAFTTEMLFGGGRSLTISGEPRDQAGYFLSASLRLVPAGRLVISTHLESLVTRISGEDQLSAALKGSINSRYSLVNFRPARELEGTFRIDGRRLFVDRVSLGPAEISGEAELRWPFPYSAQVILTAVDFDAFMDLWLMEKKSVFEGYVSGKVDINGTIERAALGGRLTSQGIGFNQWYYDQMEINFSGTYPHVYIQNSALVRDDGLKLAIRGPYNLASQHNYKSQIRMLQISPVITDNPDKLEWTLRSLKSQGEGRTELKYMRRKNDRAGFPNEEEPDIIGIQRKMEF